jgi:hypothetical protein
MRSKSNCTQTTDSIRSSRLSCVEWDDPDEPRFDADAPQQIGEPWIVSNCIESGADTEREDPRLALAHRDVEHLECAVGLA